jgi:hypothetical protein
MLRSASKIIFLSVFQTAMSNLINPSKQGAPTQEFPGPGSPFAGLLPAGWIGSDRAMLERVFDQRNQLREPSLLAPDSPPSAQRGITVPEPSGLENPPRPKASRKPQRLWEAAVFVCLATTVAVVWIGSHHERTSDALLCLTTSIAVCIFVSYLYFQED